MENNALRFLMEHLELVLWALFVLQAISWLCSAKQSAKKISEFLLWILVTIGIGLQIATGMWQDGKLEVLNFHDYYHYYFGSKYFPELGYKKLYICSSVAITELSHPLTKELANDEIRDLSGKKATIHAQEINPDKDCKTAFTPERWKSFLADSAIFLEKDASKETWTGIFRDFGNNPPPTWYLLAFSSLKNIQLDNKSFDWINKVDFIILVAVIPIIIALSLGNVAAAGYLMLLFFNYLAPLNWIVGSFGRSFWIITLFLAYIFFNKTKLKTSAFFFALSFLFGIFPLVFFACTLLFQFLEKRKIHEVTQMIGVFSTTVFLLIGLSAMQFGIEAWQGFFNIVGVRINMAAPPAVCFWKAISFLFINIYSLHVNSVETLGIWLSQVSQFYNDHIRSITSYQVALVIFTVTSIKQKKQPAINSLLVGFLIMFLFMKPLAYYYMYLPFLLVFYDKKIRGWEKDAIWLLALMAILELWSIPFLAMFNYYPDFYQITSQVSLIISVYFLCHALFGFYSYRQIRQTGQIEAQLKNQRT